MFFFKLACFALSLFSSFERGSPKKKDEFIITNRLGALWNVLLSFAKRQIKCSSMLLSCFCFSAIPKVLKAPTGCFDWIGTSLSGSGIGCDVTNPRCKLHTVSSSWLNEFYIVLDPVTQSHRAANSAFSATTIPGLTLPYMKMLPMSFTKWGIQNLESGKREHWSQIGTWYWQMPCVEESVSGEKELSRCIPNGLHCFYQLFYWRVTSTAVRWHTFLPTADASKSWGHKKERCANKSEDCKQCKHSFIREKHTNMWFSYNQTSWEDSNSSRGQFSGLVFNRLLITMESH